MYSARSIGLTVTKGSGGEDLVLCPFHADNRPSAWFSERKGLFYCAVCDLGLNVEQLMQRMGLDVSEIEVEGNDYLPDFDLMNEELALHLDPRLYHPYYKKRGVVEDVFQEFGLRWRERGPQAAVLPITNYFGDVQGLCLRYVNPQESGTRYKKVGEMTPIWPMHHLSRLTSDRVLVVEGAFSALRIASFLYQFGLEPATFALLGAKANRGIAEVLSPFQPVFLYDNDLAGQRACKRMRELMPLAKSYTLNKAPDDMNDEELEKLLNRIVNKVIGK